MGVFRAHRKTILRRRKVQTVPHLPGSPPVELTLRRSARARRFSLRVSRLDGRVTLSLPHGARMAEAMAFAQGQEAWIRAALAALPQTAVVCIGSAIPVQGLFLTLARGPGRLVRAEGDALMIPGDPAQAGVRAAAYLKLLARGRLTAASDRYSALIGRPYTRITLRDTRSRWGSCTVDGGLMYSWRLAMAPPEVLDYVAAHEVAHLAEMNHAPAFWAVVRHLMPGYDARRSWLKAQGQTLHGYRFGHDGD